LTLEQYPDLWTWLKAGPGYCFMLPCFTVRTGCNQTVEAKGPAVQLVRAHITNYRSVEDSGEFAIEPHVTCLVGNNESGKTADLQASTG